MVQHDQDSVNHCCHLLPNYLLQIYKMHEDRTNTFPWDLHYLQDSKMQNPHLTFWISDNQSSSRSLSYSREAEKCVVGAHPSVLLQNNPRALLPRSRWLVKHDSPTRAKTFSWSGWHSSLGIFQVNNKLNMSTTYICIFNWQWHSLAGILAGGLQHEKLPYSPSFLLNKCIMLLLFGWMHTSIYTHSNTVLYILITIL